MEKTGASKCRELNDYIKGKVTKHLLTELLKQDDKKHSGVDNTPPICPVNQIQQIEFFG